MNNNRVKLVLGTCLSLLILASHPVQAIRLDGPGPLTKPVKIIKTIKRKPVKRVSTLKPKKVPRPAQRAVKTPVKRPTVPIARSVGNCESWIRAAGITDVVNARELIRRESGCNPYARNASSGACGVAQELPCGKSGCRLGDGACQVRWMHRYVIGRYGSWAAALAHHNARNWY